MTKGARDIQALHITNPALIYVSGSQFGDIITDLTAIKTATDAILVAIENEGITAKA